MVEVIEELSRLREEGDKVKAGWEKRDSPLVMRIYNLTHLSRIITRVQVEMIGDNKVTRFSRSPPSAHKKTGDVGRGGRLREPHTNKTTNIRQKNNV